MNPNNKNKNQRFPREVWAAAISLKGLWPVSTIEKRMKDIVKRMESVFPLEPDIICLPETVNISWVNEIKTLDEIAEDEHTPGPVTSVFAEIARKQHCYIISPVVTKKDGHFYDSAILINRQGKIEGTFHKVHPTEYEIKPEKVFKGGGMTPGTLRPPVFKTDFGTIGIQICYDAAWYDGWRSLRKDGAELVLFSSQGGYGNILNNHAWMNHFNVVSSTGEDARIIDIMGDTIAVDGEFERWVCAPLNLEKEFLEIRPQVQKFDAIRKKYGRKLEIKILHPENWATIESLDPELKVLDVLKEFELPTFEEQISEATLIQDQYREK
jgi:predicted amidohydrolase